MRQDLTPSADTGGAAETTKPEPSDAAIDAAYRAMVSAIWTVNNDTTVSETGTVALREALRAAYAIDLAWLRAERDRWHGKWKAAHEGADRIEAELRARLAESERIITSYRGMLAAKLGYTLIPEDTVVRPDAMSYVKPSEFDRMAAALTPPEPTP